MPFAAVRDLQMYYEDQGQGDPLVLLHGGLATSAQWASFIPLYAQHYRVLATDRWGYGRSSPRPGFVHGYLWQEARDLAAFLDGLGVQRAHVLGHSDGGSVGLLLAILRPALVRSLVTVAGHTHSEERTLAGLRQAERLFRTSPAVRDRLGKVFSAGGADLVHVWYSHWLDPARCVLDIRAEVAQICCPTLVIQGEDDEFATPAHAEGIARAIPGAELWLIPGRAHNPQFQHREPFNERVLAFLAAH